MKYTYTCVVYEKEDETLFAFTSLPSGILCMEKTEDEKEEAEEFLMELLSEEDFLPLDNLPTDKVLNQDELVKFIGDVFQLPYMEDKVKQITVTVDDEED